MIGNVFGHTQVQTSARYADLANDSVQSAPNRIASRIADVRHEVLKERGIELGDRSLKTFLDKGKLPGRRGATAVARAAQADVGSDPF